MFCSSLTLQHSEFYCTASIFGENDPESILFHFSMEMNSSGPFPWETAPNKNWMRYGITDLISEGDLGKLSVRPSRDQTQAALSRRPNPTADARVRECSRVGRRGSTTDMRVSDSRRGVAYLPYPGSTANSAELIASLRPFEQN